MKSTLLFAAALLAACSSAQPKPDANAPSADGLEAVVAGAHRSPENKARDVYRHPVETLRFFGLEPDMQIVEISPGGGWYTEILAPYVNERGGYTAAGFPADASAAYQVRLRQALAEKFAARPDLYGNAKVTEFAPPRKVAIAPPGSADMVLTFRNVHNWMAAGALDEAFASFYRALKPGGVLGVVEHRASTAAPQDPTAPTGYVRQDYLVAAAERAGFKLDATSEINANPRDTKDHPAGVWTLPPTLRLKDQDRDKYVAVGESDRMTLRFVKPKGE